MLGGLFVGGASRRMGVPKALLQVASGETLLERTLRVMREAGIDPVLVGRRAAEPALHRALDATAVRTLVDVAVDAGPLGGLVALLVEAQGACAIAVACDMPNLTAAHLRRLVDAPRHAAIVAPRRGGRWEPLCARYDAAKVGPTALRRLGGKRLALQGLLDELGAWELPREADDDGAWLDDWDQPEDVARTSGKPDP
jgi:molybdopterin-guanine dinucleotide biosynthesis protein A